MLICILRERKEVIVSQSDRSGGLRRDSAYRAEGGGGKSSQAESDGDKVDEAICFHFVFVIKSGSQVSGHPSPFGIEILFLPPHFSRWSIKKYGILAYYWRRSR